MGLGTSPCSWLALHGSDLALAENASWAAQIEGLVAVIFVDFYHLLIHTDSDGGLIIGARESITHSNSWGLFNKAPEFCVHY